jgi:phosphate transport system permease protein
MTWSRHGPSRPSGADRALTGIAVLAAVLGASVVLAILAFVLREAWPALTRISPASFVADPGWHPRARQFNLLPMLAGTLFTTVGAMILAAPLGTAVGIFSQCYAPPRLGRWVRRLIALLAGIPSVVFGLWGLVVLVPLLSRLGGAGQSLLAAILVLTLMILPTVALTTDAALKAVPRASLQGAAALGLSRWSTIRRVALPAARGGVATGLILATARAIGETMAVLMVAGNVVQFPRRLTDPVRTLTANIALEMGYATAEHRAVLFVGGLGLMLAVAILVALVHGRGSPPSRV